MEDDKEIRDGVEIYLKNQGYQVWKAANGKEGLEIVAQEEIHLAILDIMMPVMDGLEMIRQIKENNNICHIPIIVLSAKASLDDRIAGLEQGIDDYITKPFSMEELLLRIEAVLRRSTGLKPEDEQEIFKIGKLTFNSKKQTLFDGEEEQKLTTKESELLRLLCLNVNKVLERNYALKNIWADDNYFNARSMDVYITKLRKHLKKDPSVEIINVHGKGYKLIL